MQPYQVHRKRGRIYAVTVGIALVPCMLSNLDEPNMKCAQKGTKVAVSVWGIKEWTRFHLIMNNGHPIGQKGGGFQFKISCLDDSQLRKARPTLLPSCRPAAPGPQAAAAKRASGMVPVIGCHKMPLSSMIVPSRPFTDGAHF